MAQLRRLSQRELLMFVVFVVVLGGAGYIARLESEVTPVWMTAQARISLGGDGLGIFIWRAQGGFWTDVADRKTVFDVGPSTRAQIVSLNGRSVGKSSGNAATDRSGRVVVVVKAGAEGPITVRGIDLRSGRSATAVRWSVAD